MKPDAVDPRTVLAIAAEADCDPRTVVKVLEGHVNRISRSARRVLKALEGRGIAVRSHQTEAA